ncbi:unnamed protein product [marine sediment metagenome]|uniref:FAD synthase n=1 Tax=marine sediment metagenome TaxID=412755 RepID=X1UDE2_9ZZZZ
MQVEKELAELQPKKDTLLTIGVFDGVHLGHKYLLSQLTEQAREQNLLSGVVTFNQHPHEVLLPQREEPAPGLYPDWQWENLTLCLGLPRWLHARLG